jgi:hypothetical protein
VCQCGKLVLFLGLFLGDAAKEHEWDTSCDAYPDVIQGLSRGWAPKPDYSIARNTYLL